MADSPWGPIDPNSQHQLWSEWTFTVYEGARRAPFRDVQENARRWLRLGFGSVGQMKVERRLMTCTLPDGTRVPESVYVITLQVEGAPAHDPKYVAHVRLEFLQRFVAQGWGPLAACDVTVRVLAGDTQDGRPPARLVVLPTISAGG